MSLLGKLVGNQTNYEIPDSPTRTEIQNAVTIIGLAAIGADGHFDRNEVVELQNSLIGMPLYQGTTSDEAFNRAAKLFEKDREAALSWAVGVCENSGWSNTAFVFACSLVFTDGDIDGGEANYIELLNTSLGINEMFAENVANTFTQLYRAE